MSGRFLPRILAALVATAVLPLVLSACTLQVQPEATQAEPAAQAEQGEQQANLPEEVVAQRANFFPEGIEWNDVNKDFLLGSIAEGTIFQVADDGTVTPFVEDDTLRGTIGIQVDDVRNRLLVADNDPAVLSDPAVEGAGAIGIYDLASGEPIDYVSVRDLRPTGKQFVNDVAVAVVGTAYATDSFAPVIYQIDLEGNASILIDDERLNPEPVEAFGSPIGLNGIVFDPDGYLLVANTAAGALFKVPLANPEDLTEVQLDEPIGADGMILRPNGELVAVATTLDEDGNPQSEVVELFSSDDWASATVVNREDVSDLPPTTVTLRDGAVYAIAAHLSAMMQGESVDSYEIYRVDLSGL